jgi:hypothetical protein
MAHHQDKPSGPAQPQMLRDEIDHGGRADKVDYPDPAAAPLGTDDEAAGDGVYHSAPGDRTAEGPGSAAPLGADPSARAQAAAAREPASAVTARPIIPIVLIGLVIVLGLWALL